jgi:4-hydroxy-2-oxoheptanedioate aldolase
MFGARMLRPNLIKQKLGDGKPVIGTWNTLGSPIVTEVMARAGFDFQIIDLEHGPFVLDQVHLHVSACQVNSSCCALVRIPKPESWMALQVLDQGAEGIVVPHIGGAEDAQKLVNSVKYYPQGSRGFTPFSKAGGFNNLDVPAYVQSAINETVAVAIVESAEGLNNLDEILEVDGVDVVYFGAYDLSQALGHPGEARHPDVVNAIRAAVERVNRTGKAAGGFVPQSRSDIEWLLDMGMRFITYEVDSSILYTNIHAVTDWFFSEVS